MKSSPLRRVSSPSTASVARLRAASPTAAGVNEITIFRQFGSKEALLREAMVLMTQSVGLTTLPEEPVDPGGADCME